MKKRSFIHDLMLFANKRPDPVAASPERTKALAALKERFIKFKMPPEIADAVCGAAETEQAPMSFLNHLLSCPDREFAEAMLAGVEAVRQVLSEVKS